MAPDRKDPSPVLIAGVAATTVHRDRDEIELSLVRLLVQFLEAGAVTTYKMTRDAGRDWVTPCLRVEAAGGGTAIARGGGSLPLDTLPTWALCLENRIPQSLLLAGGGVESVHPITDGSGTPVGMLRVEGLRALSPREIELVGGILQIVRNHLALIDYGERDTLTGLLNRKTFEHQFEKLREASVTDASGQEPGQYMGLVDIDHFKNINDRFGHVFGDEVLLLVSQIIQRAFRGVDHVYRFGGEEFVILLRGATEDGAAGVMERLRAAVEKHSFPQVGTVTISLGWTRICEHDMPTSAIERADTALYHAKRTGRNRLCHFEALVSSGELPDGSHAISPEVELF
jgi:diguanylate cyclase (GGDEF)-like protein